MCRVAGEGDGRMTDRVDIYGALDWVSQACDDYLGKQEGEEETKRQVEALAEGVRKKMESLRGGAYARAFQMAALQYDMERHAEGGMGKEAFHQRYFSHKDDGDMKEAPAQTYYFIWTSRTRTTGT